VISLVLLNEVDIESTEQMPKRDEQLGASISFHRGG
jgi:hypothetical protein